MEIDNVFLVMISYFADRQRAMSSVGEAWNICKTICGRFVATLEDVRTLSTRMGLVLKEIITAQKGFKLSVLVSELVIRDK